MDGLDVRLTVPRRGLTVRADLRVGREVVALIGPSGAGKTTVLRSVAGLDRPREGRIALGDRVWFDHTAGVDVPPEERRVGVVFAHHALFPHLSVRGNVAFSRRGDPDAMLTALGIPHLAGARPATLSAGERQRVALARALAREPEALLLDEPLAALDPHTRATVRRELARTVRAAGVPTLIVTHDPADLALADRVVCIERGAVTQEGTAAELAASPATEFVAAVCGPGPV